MYFPTLNLTITDRGFMYDEDFYNEMSKLESNWKRDQKRLTILELANIYPEAKDLIIKNVKRQLKKLSQELQDLLEWDRSQSKYKIDSKYEYKFIHSQQMRDKINAQIKKHKNYLAFLTLENNKQDDYQIRLAKAKTFPLDSVIEFNRAGFAKCFLHNERTPSLKFYPASNTCHCFSCDKSFDVIDVVSQLKNCSFWEAIKQLS